MLAVRLEVSGRAAHGSTPWEGDNAILKAFAVFRTIESLPFSRESSELFDRPSINLGRIWGGDALNKVPDSCVIDVDIRYLPEQDAGQKCLPRSPRSRTARSSRPSPARPSPSTAPRASCGRSAPRRKPHHEGEVTGVGRDGASDAISFLRAGIPAVEFGPLGAGHHGPEEWVSVSSLGAYRRALGDFARSLPAALALEEAR